MTELPLKLEPGKYYRTRDGRCVAIHGKDLDCEDEWPWVGRIHRGSMDWWAENGKCWKEPSEDDLVAEWEGLTPWQIEKAEKAAPDLLEALKALFFVIGHDIKPLLEDGTLPSISYNVFSAQEKAKAAIAKAEGRTE